jgi:hypothetical protein
MAFFSQLSSSYSRCRCGQVLRQLGELGTPAHAQHPDGSTLLRLSVIGAGPAVRAKEDTATGQGETQSEAERFFAERFASLGGARSASLRHA